MVCKEEDDERVSADQAYWERAAGDGKQSPGKGRNGGCRRAMGLTRGERILGTGMGRNGGGMRLHTPPRGLPHSDSPIRMSK